jgi:fibronectin-binding autotransporter adhesin
MQTTKIFKTAWLFTALLAISLTTARAQTATWIGPATGGTWNTAASWDLGLVPGDTTNVLIGAGTNVTYSSAMSAPDFAALSLNGILNVNAGGFNCSSITMLRVGGGNRLWVNNGGVVNTTGNLAATSNAWVTLAAGASVTVQGSLLVGAGATGGTGTGTAGCSGYMTNNGATLNAGVTSINTANASATSLLVVNGGVNNLGNVTINRYGPTSAPVPGADGLAIYNGLVNMTGLAVGGSGANSYLSMLVTGGTVTNTGGFIVHIINTAGRPARFLQTGGLFVTSYTNDLSQDTNIVFLSPSGAAGVTAIFSVTGGTNIAGGFQFGDAVPNLGTANFTNAATIYVGSQGIASNGAVTLSASLNNGGLFGATADWTGSAAMKLTGGTFTFQATDLAGTAHNITLSEVLSGSGILKKTGGGTLTLNAADTNTGVILINGGTLALGANGSVSNSPQIIVGSGTTFDVSSVSGGFVLNVLQTLAGSGVVTGAVTVASTGIVNPGSNTLTGTLTFTNDLTESGGAVNYFDLSSDPSGLNNDFINIAGNLNASGVNTIEISGSLQSGGVYKLIRYGTLNGDLSNFTLTGAGGSLSNGVDKIIYLIATGGSRSPANVTWLGNALTNTWDMLDVTNWSINGTGIPTNFISGDNARFGNGGALYPLVNVVGSVTPASTIVDTTSNYTFSGTGLIGGLGNVTKTNSGTLSLLLTNSYTGSTIFAGGVVEVPTLANGGVNSPIGASSADPESLVFNGGTLRYLGDSAGTDRGATLNASSTGTFDVTNSATTLTISGTLTGGGGLTKVGEGTLTLAGANSYTGITTISNGTLGVSDVVNLGTNSITFAGGTLALASTPIKHSYPNTLNVVSDSTLIVYGASAYNVLASAWSGSGTLNVRVANAADYCTLDAPMTTAFTGTIHLTDDSAGYLRFNSGGNSSGAQACVGSPTATFDLGNGSVTMLNRNGGNTNYYLGALAGGSSTSLRGAPGTGSPNGYQIGDKNLDTMFAGIIANGGVSAAVVTIIKVGTGTLTLEGQNGYTGSTIVSNGVLALSYNPTNSNNGSIDSSTNINIASGAVLDVSSRDDGKLPLGSSQTLRGNGTLRGILDNTGGGTVSPGASIGTLTVTNNINLGGVVWMEINRASSPNCDKLVSSLSSINYGGKLVVTNIGPRLQAGDTFVLFSGSGLDNATFGTVELPNYYTWNTNLDAGTVSVATVLPLPSISSITTSGSDITLNAVGGIAGGQVIVLTSTNIVAPLGQWTALTTSTFDGDGNFNYTVTGALDSGLPEQFYILQVY